MRAGWPCPGRTVLPLTAPLSPQAVRVVRAPVRGAHLRGLHRLHGRRDGEAPAAGQDARRSLHQDGQGPPRGGAHGVLDSGESKNDDERDKIMTILFTTLLFIDSSKRGTCLDLMLLTEYHLLFHCKFSIEVDIHLH